MKTHLQNGQQETPDTASRIVDDPRHWRMARPTRVIPGGLAEPASAPVERNARRHANRAYERSVSEWWWI